MIAVSGLRRAFGEFMLGPATFTAGRGEYWVLLGPSGAGKSMLLHTIAGIFWPDSGTVTISGRDVTASAPEVRNGSISAADASGNRTATSPSHLQYQALKTGQSWDVGFGATGSFSSSTIVSVTVNGASIPIGGDPTPTPTPPTVSLASSATSVTTAGSITLTATASANGGVTKVEFYDGTSLLGSDTTSPYAYSVSLTAANNASHSYTGKAYDAAGNSATSSAVSVVVNISGGAGVVYTSSSGKVLKSGAELKGPPRVLAAQRSNRRFHLRGDARVGAGVARHLATRS